MARDKLKQAVGNWVVGERFWDREVDLDLLMGRVDDGAHQLLVAQRRMGKTSLMREAALRLQDRYVCPFVDLQKSRSAADAIVALSLATHPYKSLWQKGRGLFSNILEKATDAVEQVDLSELGVKLRAGLTAGNWASKGDQLLAILAGSDKPVLLLLDEVPILVNRILKDEDFKITPERRAQADEFMSWLRENSIRHQGKLRIVVSGSIGLEPILRQAGLSATLNNFVPFELDPWDDETAAGCLTALANEYGIQYENNAATEMVRRLGCCIPHHVEMFFQYVHARCKKAERMTFSAEEVDKLYQEDMLGTRGHLELTTYEDRLKQVLGKEACPLAMDMLTEAAVTGHLSLNALEVLQGRYDIPDQSGAEAQKEILWVLQHDGYLKQKGAGFVFISNLLRDWWRKRHELFYTPVAQQGA